MLKISLTNDTIVHGSSCEFKIHSDDTRLKYQVFLKHENILYVKPLSDWVSTDTFSLLPEAPGRYTLLLKWQTENQKTGYTEYPFQVISNIEPSSIPQLVPVDPETSFWVPNTWDAQLIGNYEKEALKIALSYIKPGWTVYDIGANMGYYTIYLSRAVGKKGHVYSFEANPVCVYFLQANLAQNDIHNCDIIPSAILDNFETVPFTLNYSSSGLGITQKSSFFISKLGHEIGVQGYSLDRLVEEKNIIPPNLLKLDIEGAEEYAINGMMKILQKNHPIILIEIHGATAAQHTIPLLGDAGYKFRTLEGKTEDANSFLASFTDKVIQLVCLPTRKKWF